VVPLEARLCPDAAALAAPVLPPGSVLESGALLLPVTGAGFVRGSVVLYNDRVLPTAFISSTELMVFIPRISVFSGNGRTVRRFTLEERLPSAITVFTPGVGQSLPTTLWVREQPDPAPGTDALDPI
jgi:hypothetical protein